MLITVDSSLKTSEIIYTESNSTLSNGKPCLAVAHSAAEMEPNPAPYITTSAISHQPEMAISFAKIAHANNKLGKLSHIFALKIKATVRTFLDASVPKIWTNM